VENNFDRFRLHSCGRQLSIDTFHLALAPIMADHQHECTQAIVFDYLPELAKDARQLAKVAKHAWIPIVCAFLHRFWDRLLEDVFTAMLTDAPCSCFPAVQDVQDDAQDAQSDVTWVSEGSSNPVELDDGVEWFDAPES
jgi:hypothetical protein